MSDEKKAESATPAGEGTPEALVARITAYLSLGGLWSPDLMDHDKVRDLLIDCRDALASQPSARHATESATPAGGEIFGANCQECGNWVEMNPDAPLAPSAPNAVDPVREALRKLVEQIDVVIASPEYESVFAMGMIRGQPYRGPQFADQLEAARRALESTPSREKP